MTGKIAVSILAAAFASVARCGDGVTPAHAWDFDTKRPQGGFVDVGEKGGKYVCWGTGAFAQGVDASDALCCSTNDSPHVAFFPIESGDVTVDVTFRLAAPLDGKTPRTVWHYALGGWGQSRYRMRITGMGALEFSIRDAKRKEIFCAQSDIQTIKAGRWYMLRTSVGSDGTLTVHMDGMLVMKKSGAKTLNEIRPTEIPKWYPLLKLGIDNDNPDTKEWSLNGVIDNVRIYSCVIGGGLSRGDAPDGEVPIPEYRADVDADSEVLVLDANGAARSGRFRVLDHEEEILGAWKAADRKFIENASTAELSLTADTIAVTVDCPVPSGMTARGGKSAFSGDCVEVFVRPSLDRSRYFQYAVNMDGIKAANAFVAPMVKDAAFESGAKMKCEKKVRDGGFRCRFEIPLREVFPKPPKPGDVFGLNFTRSGETCSGQSSWAAVGGQYHNIDAFGRCIVGGVKAYFRREVEVFTECAATEAVRKAIEEHGDEPGAYAALERMIRNLDKGFLEKSLAGKGVILFRGANPWGNDIEPSATTRPLENISLRAAKNSKRVFAFTAANLRGRPFLGQIKLFDERPKNSFNFTKPVAGGIARRFTVMRGFSLYNRDGREIYDPVEPLSMRTLLRLAPNENAPLYLELDTHGVEAGTYHSLMTLKSATPGCPSVSIAVKAEVTELDLDGVQMDKAGYDYVGGSFVNGRDGCPRLVRQLVERDYNILFVGYPNQLLPRMRNEGGWGIPDLGALDRHIDAAFAGGLAKERAKLWIYLGMESQHPWNVPRTEKGGRVPFASEEWNAGIRYMVEELVRHVGERHGISRDRVIWYPVDEPSGPLEDPTWKSNIARAYHSAKTIKAANAKNVTMVDPLPQFLKQGDIKSVMPRFAEVFDIVEIYRPACDAAIKAVVDSCRFREVWTYSIVTKETQPDLYRRDVWQNLRDGWGPVAAYWHMTSHAGGDGFDSTDTYGHSAGEYSDYGTLYVDFDLDTGITSRRQLAVDQAHYDAKTVAALRNRFRSNPSRLAEIKRIVGKTADTGTMGAMDAAIDILLSIPVTGSEDHPDK